MATRWSWVCTTAAMAAVAAVGTGACSSSGSNNVSPTQACSDLATALCNREQACAPFDVQLVYGSVSTCITRAQINCPDAISATGSGTTAADIESCAQAVTSTSCSDLESNNAPSACIFAGTLTAGSVCGSDEQCVGPNGYCKVAAGATCGACAAKAAAGGTCAGNDDCQAGLVCPSGGGSCVAPGAAGATCSSAHPCTSPLVCVSTTCTQPAEAGQACQESADGQNCDVTQGVVCNTSTMVCSTIGTAAAGAPCGLINGGYTLCSGGATCNLSGTMGTCGSVAADGAACGGTSGASCLPPAVCVNDTCTLPNASSCH